MPRDKVWRAISKALIQRNNLSRDNQQKTTLSLRMKNNKAQINSNR